MLSNQSKNTIDLLLAESLKELSKARPIEKITIKEITDKAGVIRPTFYNHFQDKYELLEWIAVNELVEPADPLLANGMLKESITFILTAMAAEKDFYKKAMMLEGQNSFKVIFTSCLKSAGNKYIDLTKLKQRAPYEWMTSEVIADFYAHSICYGVEQWVNGGMVVPPEELADVYVNIFHGSIIDLISRKTDR